MNVLENDEIIVFYEKSGENVLTRAILKDTKKENKKKEEEVLSYSYSLTTHKYTFTKDNGTTYICNVKGVEGAVNFEALSLALSIYVTVKKVDSNNHMIEFTIQYEDQDTEAFIETLATAMDKVLTKYEKNGVASAIKVALDDFGFYDSDSDEVVNAIYNLLISDARNLDGIVEEKLK